MKNWTLHCKAKSIEDSACADDAIISPLSLFKLMGIDPKDIEKKTQDELNTAFENAINNKALLTQFSTFFDSKVSKDNLQVLLMRAFIKLGAPLEIDGIRFSDKNDRNVEQDGYIKTFVNQINEELAEKYEDESGFRFHLFNLVYQQEGFQRVVNEDTTYAVFSVMFVFVYLIYHL